MDSELIATIGDTVAGVLTRSGDGKLRFTYDDSYRRATASTPLSLSMPLQIRTHDKAITPWLWGLLPDNGDVLRRWARQFQVSASSPYSLLSTPIGEDCAGAVRFIDPARLEHVFGKGDQVNWLDDKAIAKRLNLLKRDSTSWLGENCTGQFSLAGAQAKTAFIFENGRWGESSGSIPTTHILKPAVSDLDDHDLNEHLCLQAARTVGLIAARTRVQRFEDESAIVVDRYDRVRIDGELVRVHQEDLCQALGFAPTNKYQNEGGPSPKDIASFVWNSMPRSEASELVSRFADALIWNWIILGTDAHAKNYSLLLSGDQIRLAPLYDVASALPYGAHENRLKFAMKLGDTYAARIYGNPWIRVAMELHIDGASLVDRAIELVSQAPDAFLACAQASDVAMIGSDMPSRLVDLVSERAMRCKRMLERAHDTDG